MVDPEKLIQELEAKLNEIDDAVYKMQKDLKQKGMLKLAKIANDINSVVLETLDKIKENRVKLLKFLELTEKFKDSPEELIYLLSLPEIPITKGAGKKIAEAIAGFRGLGIEPIDHKIDEIKYEGISPEQDENPLTEISITNFIYRSSPFELASCSYESDIDKKISEILGSRFVWFLKPQEVTWDSWNEILSKTNYGKPTLLIRGKYKYENYLIIPTNIEYIDLSKRSIILEIGGKYQFFLKYGSSVIEKEAITLTTKEKLLQYLKEKLGRTSRGENYVLGSSGLRLDYVYFCYKGQGLSTDPFDLVCPFKNNCRLSQIHGGPCDGKIFWSGNYHRRRFYPKSYPLKRLKIVSKGKPVYEAQLPILSISFAAYDKGRIESRWYAVEIGTWFINARPTVRIFFDTNIGYSIPTSIMSVTFNKEWLNEILKNILVKEKDVRRNLALKWILYKSLGRSLNYRKLSETIQNLIEKKGELTHKYIEYIEKSSIDEELLSYARRVLLHSLEHSLTRYILERFLGVDMNFVLTKYYPIYSNEVIIAENAKNGRLGIVDTITRTIREKGLNSFIFNFVSELTEYLSKHSANFDESVLIRMKEAERNLNQALLRLERGDTKEKEVSKKIKRLSRKVDEFRKRLENSNIELDITLARTVLLAGRVVREVEVEDIGDYFDDILERYGFKLCLDGCNGCVRLERFCGEGIQQVLTTSRSLLLKFAEYLKNDIVSGKTLRDNNLGNKIEPILFNATSRLYVICPYISPIYAKKLVEVASRGVEVKVITWMPKKDEEQEYGYQKESLRILKENLNLNSLSVKIMDKPEIKLIHEKTYIVDNMVITGSFNLTERAFYGNLERADIKFHPDVVTKEKEYFDKLWKESNDLSIYEIN